MLQPYIEMEVYWFDITYNPYFVNVSYLPQEEPLDMKNYQYRESLYIGNFMCSKRQQRVQAAGALTGKGVGREIDLQYPWNQYWLAIAKEKNARSTIINS